MSSNENSLIGSTLDGRYRIIERIGAGGTGVVYRARQLPLENEVAVKVLNASDAVDERAVERFENEARVISALRHPNTLTLIDFGRTDAGLVYLVTEYLSGRSLREVLQDGPVDPAWLLTILSETADALIEAHDNGIVHRDLKPGNLFIEQVGDRSVTKLLDFGIASFARRPMHTTTGILQGTPAYMAPEQIRGEAVDARADLYSLGVLAYECLACRVPYEGDTTVATLYKVLESEVVAFDALSPPVSVPEPLEALIFHLLEKDPARRPADARALAALIEAVSRSRPAALTIAAAHDLDSSVGRRSWLAWLGGLVVLAFLVAAGLWTPLTTKDDPVDGPVPASAGSFGDAGASDALTRPPRSLQTGHAVQTRDAAPPWDAFPAASHRVPRNVPVRHPRSEPKTPLSDPLQLPEENPFRSPTDAGP